MDWILKRVYGFLHWLLASERLPDAAPRPARAGGIAVWLLAADALDATGADGPRRRRSAGILTSLLASESLPRRDAPAADGSPTGFLGGVLAADTLPRRDARVPGEASRTGFVKWLLSPQELPPIQARQRPRGRGFVRWLLSRDEL